MVHYQQLGMLSTEFPVPMMSRFLEALQSGRVLLMDGGMGTELQRAGLAEAECGELWNLTHQERVQAIHQAYVAAGAEVLLTNTFQANRFALGAKGLQVKLDDILQAGSSLARNAAGQDRFVLADIGPMPGMEEFGDPGTLDHAIPDMRGLDGLLLETWSDALVFFAVRHFQVASWSDEAPILLSLTYERTAAGEIVTHGRHPPEWFALQARHYGVAALGVNCGRDLGMDENIDIIRRYRLVTDLPLFARPNAGTPTRVDGRWVYPLTPDKLAGRVFELLEAGASMVGGCCGTTPEHIAALRPIIHDWNERRSAHGRN